MSAAILLYVESALGPIGGKGREGWYTWRFLSFYLVETNNGKISVRSLFYFCLSR